MRLAERTLVISRRSDKARRERFTAQALAVGLEAWDYCDAFDGTGGRLSTGTPSAHGRQGRAAPAPLSPGELGCLLSHMAAWRAGLALGLESLCVLEDDTEFDPHHFQERWRDFMAAMPDDWLMVHVGEPACSSDTVLSHAAPQRLGVEHKWAHPQEHLGPRGDYCSRVGQQYGTWMMVLRPLAMQMLSAAAERAAMSEPADWLLLGLFATGRVYRPTQELFRVRDEAGIQQTVVVP